MRRKCLLLVVCLACGLTSHAKEGKPATKANKHANSASSSSTLPVTTSSAKARDLFERAMVDYENLHLERANIGWRAAAKADTDFALAYAWVAFNSRDPQEVSPSRQRANTLATHVTPGERLMIQWITNVQEGKFIAGIAAMNDMLAMYPKDKRLLYVAGNWLMAENGNDQAQKLFQRALAIDKDYPAAMNDLAYAYARNRQFGQAFGAMDRYVDLLPHEPNPHDSYGELLRMSGNFEDALEHYRMALKIDPDFVSSQLGLGDTYALMGNQEQARIEYDKAIQQAQNPADRLDYTMQKALTLVREGKYADADKVFVAVAETGRAQGLELEEAQAHRRMAEYQSDDAIALKHLDAADTALRESKTMSESDRAEERSRILRFRAVRAIRAGNQELAGSALHELETMANNSRNAVIQSSHHGAAGAVLMAQQKYAEAIPHLEEDPDDPFSMELLSRAYSQTDAKAKMHLVEAKLHGTNVPTLEQALVVTASKSKPPAN